MKKIVEKKHIAVPLSRFSWAGKTRRLSCVECPAFFPADVTVNGEIVHICFRTEDFRPLKDIKTLSAAQCLGILKELMQHITAASDWMWYPEQLIISTDTVWIGTDGHIRMLCIPDSFELALFRRLYLFTEQLKRLTDISGRDILSKFQREWMDRPYPTYRIMGAIDRLILDLQEYSSYRFIK